MVENIIQIKSGIKNCVDVSAKIQQKIVYTKKDNAQNPTPCAFETDEYLTLIRVGCLGVRFAVRKGELRGVGLTSV